MTSLITVNVLVDVNVLLNESFNTMVNEVQ